MILLATLVGLACAFGCKNDGPDEDLEEAGPDLYITKGTTYVMELYQVKLEKLVGGEDADREFRFFLNHNSILIWAHDHDANAYRIGVTAAAASYGESSYQRVYKPGNDLYIGLPSFTVDLVKDDGTVFHLDISSAKLKPDDVDETASDGEIQGELEADLQGGFSITKGETRYSGDFFGTWHGQVDESPPTVLVIPPAEGLVVGAFDVYFDEPVTAEAITDKVLLRGKDGTPLKTRVSVSESDINEFTTHIRVEPNELLPFGQRLTLAVGTGFRDLSGNKVSRPVVQVVSTPEYPPLMNNVGHDLAVGRDDVEFSLQGEAKLIDEYAGIKGYQGSRLLKLVPPKAGSRYSSAMLARIRVAADAHWLQVRVLKVARTRDANTPCLQYTVAQINGMVWNVECGPTDVPRSMLDRGDDGEYFTTPWVHLNIDVRGQRSREVVFVLEARPLDPTMNVQMEPIFLVDMVRTVWEGEDPTVIQGDLQLPK